MKIIVNGQVRDMTQEEAAEHDALVEAAAAAKREMPDEPSVEDKAEAYDILTGVRE